MSSLDELNEIKDTIAAQEAKHRPRTDLEERLLYEMANLFAKTRNDCCAGVRLADERFKPIIDKYIPDFDIEDYL